MVVNTSETCGTEQQKYLLLHYEYGRNCSDTYVSLPLAYIFPIHRKNPYKNHLSYSIFLYFCFLRTQQKSDYCSERLTSRSLYCEYSDIYLDIS